MLNLRMMILMSTPGSSMFPSTSMIRPAGFRVAVGQRMISTVTICPGCAWLAPAPSGTWMSISTRRSNGTTNGTPLGSITKRPTTVAELRWRMRTITPSGRL
jgi:hypothetical protein